MFFSHHIKNIFCSIRSLRIIGLAAIAMLVNVHQAFSQTPISLYNNFSGHVNYTVIGGSLRTSGNTVSATALRTTDTSKLNYPSGATVVGAYLYWAGSGSTPDNSVTLDGNSFTATRSFTESNNNGGMRYWFGGFVDVTSYVASQANNKTYTFGDLTVDNTGIYASSEAVLSGWAMVVVYSLPAEVKKSVNIYDGFQIFKGSQITVTPNNFYVPYALVQGKMTHITFEGDKENSSSLNGYNEEVKFNGNSLTDANNPANNQFGSLSNNFPEDSTFGVDIDTYNITSYLAPADTQATSTYSSGGDLVILNAEIISIADTANSDIQTVKTHSGGSMVAGNTVNYTINVYNNGPDTTGTIILYDSLQTGLTFVSSSFSGWTIDSSARPMYKWTHSGTHPPGWNASVSFGAFLTAVNYPTQYNTSNATSPQFDRKPWNNYSTDSLTILTPIFLTSTKTYSDLNGGSVRPGDTLRYTITVANSGNYPATNISVVDSMPTGMSVVPGSFSPSASYSGTSSTGQLVTFGNYSGPMNVGGNTTFQFKVVLDSSLLGGSTVTNVAHVRASTIDQRITSSFVPVNAAPLAIQKFQYPPGSGTGTGDTVQYYIYVTNTSSSAYSTNTTVVDTIPNPVTTNTVAGNAQNPFYIASGTYPASPTIASFGGGGANNRDTSLTWNLGILSPGEVDTIKFKMVISSTLANATVVTNRVTATNFQGGSARTTHAYIKSNTFTGSIYAQKYILPGDTIYYSLYDADLNTNSSTVQTTTLTDTNKVNTERETILFTETAANSGTLTGKIATLYGAAAGTNLDGKFNVKPGDSLRISYTDAADSAGNANRWRFFVVKVLNGHAAALSGTDSILPSETIYYTVNDSDLNRKSAVVETYTIRDSNRTTGEIENLTFTETGANTGIFTSSVLTVFGTSSNGNNNGTFAVQKGDTVILKYYDSVIVNGTNGGLKTWKTYIRGGATATLNATSAIYPADSILITVTDGDLNKSASVAETYSIKDSSITTGEVETFTVTETGINTGIFTKKLATQFGLSAGTNNDGIFNIKAGDSLRVSYLDTLLTNGGPGSIMTALTKVNGGATATITATTPIYPADSILITITDADLNKNVSVAETYSIKDSSLTTHEVETFTVTETGVNTGIFTKKLATQFGLTAGANNDGKFNVKTGDTLRVSYRDTMLTNGSPGSTITASTIVRGGSTATLTATNPIYPGDSILITITDADLNKDSLTVQTYSVKDSSITTHEVETFTVTETGANTGIFTKKLATQFGVTAGTNNDGKFNVQTNDTLRISYFDTLLTNGSSATLTAVTKVLGGVTATITATNPIYPGDSVLVTITDADLNKNAGVIETYTIKDSSKSTETENWVFTETGVNTGIFTKKYPTVFGTSVGTTNNGIFTVQAGDTLFHKYVDTLQTNGGRATIQAVTKVNGGTTGTITATNPIYPGDSILVTITDADLNKLAGSIETYSIKDSSITTGEVETFTVTETGVNTGIFTKKLATQFGLTAGTNNDGKFNVKTNDTLQARYFDTLQTNGGSVLLTAVTKVNGGTTATITATNPIYPGDSVLVTITDADLNKNAGVIETYTIKDSSKTTETENWIFTETGVNTGIFTKKYPTVFGTSVGTTNNGIFTVQAGDTLFHKYVDTLQTNGGRATIQAVTKVNGGTTATIIATNPIYPGDSVLVTITDADLNKNAGVIETYTIKDSSKTTETENWVFTETGVNTGIFTKKYPTVFGTSLGTTNNGIFTVQAGDTLYHKYVDTLQTNGGRVTLQAVTKVNGGADASIGVSSAIIAANDSSTFTITDADLNKNSSTVENYSVNVVSSTGESEVMTFTETGINTGIFTKRVATISGTTPGTNNNGIFTVQPSDTISVTYRDTIKTNGGTATISTFFRIGSVVFSTSSKTYQDLNGGFVKPPDTLQYTIKVKNSGTVTATNVALKDTLPTDVTILTGTISGSGTSSGRVISWPLFNLIVGDSATYQYKIRVDSTIASQVAAINKATIDGNGIRYQVTASFTPVNRPLMTMSKTANRATAKPGDTIMYTITYSNAGTIPAALVTVTDAQPTNTTYVPNSVRINNVAKTDTSDADEVTLSGITVQLNIGVVQPGTSGTITMKVRVN